MTRERCVKVYEVTDASYMFQNAAMFNAPVWEWKTNDDNVCKVTTMASMFQGAKVFNQPLDQWDTSTVTNMSHMFNNATAFNQDVTKWNTTNVKHMVSTFLGANAFKYSTAEWIGTNVSGKNQPADGKELQAWLIEWHTADEAEKRKVEQIRGGPPNQWDTSKITKLAQLFHHEKLRDFFVAL